MDWVSIPAAEGKPQRTGLSCQQGLIFRSLYCYLFSDFQMVCNRFGLQALWVCSDLRKPRDLLKAPEIRCCIRQRCVGRKGSLACGDASYEGA
jgi:hypothetical protein